MIDHLPRGVVQRATVTQDGTRLWSVHWQRGTGPSAVSDPQQFQTGQAVRLRSDGKLERMTRDQ